MSNTKLQIMLYCIIKAEVSSQKSWNIFITWWDSITSLNPCGNGLTAFRSMRKLLLEKYTYISYMLRFLARPSQSTPRIGVKLLLTALIMAEDSCFTSHGSEIM